MTCHMSGLKGIRKLHGALGSELPELVHVLTPTENNAIMVHGVAGEGILPGFNSLGTLAAPALP